MRSPLLPALLLLSTLAACGTALPPVAGPTSSPTAGPSHLTPAGRTRPAAPPRPPFDRHAHSLTRAGSIWVIVNKRHPLDPLTYHPDLAIVDGHYVDHRIAPYLTRLLAAARRSGRPLHVASAYRSYGYQQGVFDGLVAREGRAAAEKWSARPGYSEHQTGLAADLDLAGDPTCSLAACFARTPGGRWLAANAWRFGFVIRYTATNAGLTGYDPEPWHIRYVGTALASELRRVHATSLEAFFGVTGGNYARP